MNISVPLENGQLPDRYGKYASSEYLKNGHPVVSFPIEINDVPAGAKTLALEFVDYDAVPVGGFCFIHWLACNIDPNTKLIPENNSITQDVAMVQGINSVYASVKATDPMLACGYTGPYPPDKDHVYTLKVYALDRELDLNEGFFLNELRREIKGNVIERTEIELVSRA